jgi:Na+/proline symporter
LALISSGVAVLFQFTLFLLIGVMLFVFYNSAGHVLTVTRSDRIFPTFIVTEMPHGISGLLIAAILAAAMSNLSAALNSLSSSSIVDFYLRRRPNASEQQRILVSRAATIFWGLLLFVLAIVSRRGGRVVEVGLAIASVAYGALLGVFLLGVLTKRANERGAMAGMFVGFFLNLYIWQFTKIPFTWYVMIGSAVTFSVGWIASVLLERKPGSEKSEAHA